MKKRIYMKKCLFKAFFLLVLFYGHSLFAVERKIVLDSLVIHEKQLVLGYHIDGLMNKKTVQGLERGFTSEIIHHIRLWKKKAIFSGIVKEYVIPVKIYYDNWEDKFTVITETERRLTGDVLSVQKLCSQRIDFPVLSLSELEIGAKYYISIEISYQPVSAETYHELKDWLEGRSSPDLQGKPKHVRRGKLFNVLIDVLGFGDKDFSLKSDDFVINSTKQLQFLK